MVVGRYEERETEWQHAQVERDERQKVAATHITKALQAGEVPATSDLQAMLATAEASLHEARTHRRVTGEGALIARDLENVIRDIELILREKNAGDPLQKLAHHSKIAAEEAAVRANVSSNAGAAASSGAGILQSAVGRAAEPIAEARQDIAHGISTAYDLSTLLVRSAEFRTLFLDFANLLLDTVTERLQVTKAELNRNAAEGRGLTDVLAKTYKSTIEEPAAKTVVEAAEQGAKQAQVELDKKERDVVEGKDATKASQFTSEFGKHPAMRDVARDRPELGKATPSGLSTTIEPASTTSYAAKLGESARQQKDTSPKQEIVSLASGKEPAQEKVRKAEVNVMEKGKEKAKEAEQKAKEINDFPDAIGGGFTDDDRKELVARIQGWVNAINRKPEFQRGMRDLFDTLDSLREHLAEAAEIVREGVQGAVDVASNVAASASVAVKTTPVGDYHARCARAEAKKLLENLAQGHSLDPLVKTLRVVLDRIHNDTQFGRVMADLRALLYRTYEKPEYVNTEAFAKEVDAKFGEARELIESLRPTVEPFLREATKFAGYIATDPALEQLSKDITALNRHLFYNVLGQPTFKPQTLLDLRKVLGPLIRDQIKYVSLPMMSGSDEDMDWTVENVLLAGADFAPDAIVVENFNKAVLRPKSDEDDELNTVLRVLITGMRAKLENVRLSYARKTFPKMEDVCTFDAEIGGEGIVLELILRGAKNEDPNHAFRVTAVKCVIDELTLSNMVGIEHSHALYTFFKPILQTQTRHKLEKTIEDAAVDWMFEIDQRLVAMKEQMIDATTGL